MGITAGVPAAAAATEQMSGQSASGSINSQQSGSHQPSSSGTPGSQAPHPPFPFPPKDCRACAGAQHMIKTFQNLTSVQPGSQVHTSSHASPNPAPNPRQPPNTSLLPPAAAIAAASVATGVEKTTDSKSATIPGPPLPCPPETTELGTATWTFLHTMAAYYPEQPTGAQKSLMRSMMEGLAEFYPCSICAEHLQQQIQDSPPDVSSGSTLSLWLCKIHNEVNEMLGKPVFDCSRVMERWRDGADDCIERE